MQANNMKKEASHRARCCGCLQVQFPVVVFQHLKAGVSLAVVTVLPEAAKPPVATIGTKSSSVHSSSHSKQDRRVEEEEEEEEEAAAAAAESPAFDSDEEAAAAADECTLCCCECFLPLSNVSTQTRQST
jgi:hypothetical protein